MVGNDFPFLHGDAASWPAVLCAALVLVAGILTATCVRWRIDRIKVALFESGAHHRDRRRPPMLISTLSWRYDLTNDHSDGSPASPRVMKHMDAVARRARGAPLSPVRLAGRSRADSTPCPVSSFCGAWCIETQSGREEFLKAMELPYLIRLAIQTIGNPPDQTLFLDERGVLHNHTGPVLGRVIEEVYEDGGMHRATFRRVTSVTEYRWEGPVLTSIARTEGQSLGVTRNRRWVTLTAAGVEEMVVVNSYTKAEGDEPVVYTRTFRRRKRL